MYPGGYPQQQPVMYVTTNYAYPMQMPQYMPSQLIPSPDLLAANVQFPVPMPMPMPQYMTLPAPSPPPSQLIPSPDLLAANAQFLRTNVLSQIKCFHCGVDGHKAIHCPGNPEWCGESSALCSVHGKVRSISALQKQKDGDDKDTWECLPTSQCRTYPKRPQYMLPA